MSYFKSLAKGFVRSAVNQVGRDMGRVVSNKAYKGRHATPVRYYSAQNDSAFVKKVTDNLHQYPYKVKGLGLSFFFELIGVFMVAIMFVPYGMIVMIIYAFFTWFDKEVKVKIPTERGVITTKIKGEGKELRRNKIKAVIVAIFAIWSAWWSYEVRSTPEPTVLPPTENIETPTNEAEVLKDNQK